MLATKRQIQISSAFENPTESYIVRFHSNQ